MIGVNGRQAQILGPDGLPYRLPASDPRARERPPSVWLPPQFASVAVYQGGDNTYWHDKFDEALKNSREDALAFKRDARVKALLNERKRSVLSLRWDLEIPDDDDPKQKFVRDTVKAAVKGVPEFWDMMACLLEAIWYGKYAVQFVWGKRWYNGVKVKVPLRWEPLHGDKIGYQYQDDGAPDIPYSLIHGGGQSFLEKRGGKIITTTQGLALLLDRAWRGRFLIHHHEIEDWDFWEGEQALRKHGVGLRDHMYWTEYMVKEIQAWVMDFCERVGLGVTLWKYPTGNPQALTEAQDAAKAYDRRVNLFVPCWEDGKGGLVGGVERVDPPLAGCNFLMGLMEYYDRQVERLVIGQEASSKGVSAGLGNEATAENQADTKIQITVEDAHRLEARVTGWEYEPGLINQMVRFTEWPDPEMAHTPLRFVLRVGATRSDKKMAAARQCWDMGVDIRADEVREAAGFTKPAKGEEAVHNTELEMAAQQAKQAGGEPGAEGAPPGGPDNPPLGSFLQSLQDTSGGGEEETPKESSDDSASYARRGEPLRYENTSATGGSKWVEAPPTHHRVDTATAKNVRWRNVNSGALVYYPRGVNPNGGDKPEKKPEEKPAAKAQPQADEHQEAARKAFGELAGLQKDGITPENVREWGQKLSSLSGKALGRLKDTLRENKIDLAKTAKDRGRAANQIVEAVQKHTAPLPKSDAASVARTKAKLAKKGLEAPPGPNSDPEHIRDYFLKSFDTVLKGQSDDALRADLAKMGVKVPKTASRQQMTQATADFMASRAALRRALTNEAAGKIAERARTFRGSEQGHATDILAGAESPQQRAAESPQAAPAQAQTSAPTQERAAPPKDQAAILSQVGLAAQERDLNDAERELQGVNLKYRPPVPRHIAEQFDAHGTQTLSTLTQLLNGGIDPGRPFYTSRLSDAYGAKGTGSEVRDSSSFVVLSHPGKSLKEGGVAGVLVDPLHTPDIPNLQKAFPGVKFVAAEDAAATLAKVAAKPQAAPAAQAKPAKPSPMAPEAAAQALAQTPKGPVEVPADKPLTAPAPAAEFRGAGHANPESQPRPPKATQETPAGKPSQLATVSPKPSALDRMRARQQEVAGTKAPAAGKPAAPPRVPVAPAPQATAAPKERKAPGPKEREVPDLEQRKRVVNLLRANEPVPPELRATHQAMLREHLSSAEKAKPFVQPDTRAPVEPTQATGELLRDALAGKPADNRASPGNLKAEQVVSPSERSAEHEAQDIEARMRRDPKDPALQAQLQQATARGQQAVHERLKPLIAKAMQTPTLTREQAWALKPGEYVVGPDGKVGVIAEGRRATGDEPDAEPDRLVHWVADGTTDPMDLAWSKLRALGYSDTKDATASLPPEGASEAAARLAPEDKPAFDRFLAAARSDDPDVEREMRTLGANTPEEYATRKVQEGKKQAATKPQGAAAPQPATPRAPTATPSRPAQDDFARSVVAAAESLPNTMGGVRDPSAAARSGHKVFVADLYEHLKPKLGGMTLGQFKAKLLQEHLADRLGLLRDDLANTLGVGQMRRSEASEIPYLNATFHAVDAHHRPAAQSATPVTPAAQADEAHPWDNMHLAQQEGQKNLLGETPVPPAPKKEGLFDAAKSPDVKPAVNETEAALRGLSAVQKRSADWDMPQPAGFEQIKLTHLPTGNRIVGDAEGTEYAVKDKAGKVLAGPFASADDAADFIEEQAGTKRRIAAEGAAARRGVRSDLRKRAYDELGYRPEEIDSLAREIQARHVEAARPRAEMLRDAADMLANPGRGRPGIDLNKLRQDMARDKVEDPASVPGLDEVAKAMARKYGGLFHGWEDATGGAEGMLFDMIRQGPPRPLTENGAYEQAFRELEERGPAPTYTPETEAVPFRRGRPEYFARIEAGDVEGAVRAVRALDAPERGEAVRYIFAEARSILENLKHGG